MIRAGVPDEMARLNWRALSLAAALSATTVIAGPVTAQEAVDQDVAELTVWFAREYTVPSRERS